MPSLTTETVCIESKPGRRLAVEPRTCSYGDESCRFERSDAFWIVVDDHDFDVHRLAPREPLRHLEQPSDGRWRPSETGHVDLTIRGVERDESHYSGLRSVVRRTGTGAGSRLWAAIDAFTFVYGFMLSFVSVYGFILSLSDDDRTLVDHLHDRVCRPVAEVGECRRVGLDRVTDSHKYTHSCRRISPRTATSVSVGSLRTRQNDFNPMTHSDLV